MPDWFRERVTALLVQHELGALPIGMRRSGVLQLFACRGGWPAWEQDRALSCERCGKDCTLALQVPGHEGYPFADGTVFVLVCDHAPCTWAGAVLQYT